MGWFGRATKAKAAEPMLAETVVRELKAPEGLRVSALMQARDMLRPALFESPGRYNLPEAGFDLWIDEARGMLVTKVVLGRIVEIQDVVSVAEIEHGASVPRMFLDRMELMVARVKARLEKETA